MKITVQMVPPPIVKVAISSPGTPRFTLTTAAPYPIKVKIVVPGSISGPRGEQGEQGPAGVSKQTIYPIAIARDTWLIDHGLNAYPQVTTIDSANTKVEGAISYPSLNQVLIKFTVAFAGQAILT